MRAGQLQRRDRALALHGSGPYVLQAAIASLHADQPSDWTQIAALYGAALSADGLPLSQLPRSLTSALGELPHSKRGRHGRFHTERLQGSGFGCCRRSID